MKKKIDCFCQIYIKARNAYSYRKNQAISQCSKVFLKKSKKIEKGY